MLAGLVKRIADGATAISVGTPADVEAFKAANDPVGDALRGSQGPCSI